MPLIGIIAKENDSNFIKNEILRNSLNTKFEIVNISKRSLENIKNITFESLIINNDVNEMLKTSKYLENIIKRAKYLIVNSDISNDLNFFNNNNLNVLTYGLNAKATITVSSIKEDKVLIYIQKNLESISNKVIEEQEFNIKVVKNNIQKTYNMLAIFTLLSVYEEKVKNF